MITYIDFRPIITRTSNILPLSVVTGDKGYDSEDNHVLVREELYAFSVIPSRYEHVPIWRTHGKYRKQMKRGYSKLLYNQRNKDETIISVIKRLFGEHITSRLVRTQNRELSFRCIAYNTHRLTNLTIITWFLQSHMNIKRNIQINSKEIDAFYKAIGALVKQNSSPSLQKSQIDSFLNFLQDSLPECLEWRMY
jgi:hypothetical protein